MAIADRIQQYVQELPAALQAEVLDFVEYLLARAGREDAEWSQIALTAALRGMENEEPPYEQSDIKEEFR